MRIASVVALLLLAGLAAHAEPIGGLGVLWLGQDGATPGEVAARNLAVKTFGAREVSLDAEGRLAIPADLRALWWHCEQTRLPAAMDAGAVKKALLTWLEQGHGLFLSGAALFYVQTLGLEPATPRLGNAGQDTFVAGVMPNPPDHPVYAGFPPGQPVKLVSGGYPAFSDFHGSDGPYGGNVIGKANPDAGENPFCEFGHGKGRIITLGWRCPHYGLQDNKYRANLEQLTGNVLRYLAKGEWFGQIVDSRARLLQQQIGRIDAEAMRRAIADLMTTYPDKYPNGAEYLALLDRLPEVQQKALDGDEAALTEARGMVERLNGALLDNPLLDFGRLLVVKRSAGNLGLPANWESNSSLPRNGFDNEIDVLRGLSPDGELTTLYRPAKDVFVGDVDLHWDAGKLMFSSVADDGRWRIFEMNVDGSGLQQLPLIDEPDVDDYDSCYLPNDDIIFTSTAPFVGVPCVTGSAHVSNLYYFDRRTGGIRQLGFEQDHDWCPTVLNNGRVLYLRWEYSDIPHFVSRILFHMNPDGTEQMEFYGSNSYWPNSTFYARPIPGSATEFVGIVVGHHDNPRMGELVLFDTDRGKHEGDGVIQRIPGYGKKVQPILLDGLTSGSWPKFLHPYPLSDKYFLVACRPTPASNWGIYLADVFDNLTLIKEVPGYALLEPVPLRPTPRPPVIPNRVDPARNDGLVYMADIYDGAGLAGVPRGAVKQLRLFTYHFAYHGMGGQVNRVGYDGPWDIKRIVGTVPVEPDGSAYFRIPANTPISLQPLDENGQALQLMRSWMTAMPGETLSCVGCHEKQQMAPPSLRPTAASVRKPVEITRWYGPTRGFSFVREVQPVLDKYCISCHDGKPGPNGEEVMDLRDAPAVHPPGPDNGYQQGSKFTPSYMALKRYVRNHTIESDIHLLMPGEFAADTTRLMQLLRKGHHGVQLEPEAWDRLTTWIDLNTPAHGTWHEIVGNEKVDHMRDRRRAMFAKYAGRDEDPEEVLDLPVLSAQAPVVQSEVAASEAPTVPGWPFDPQEAERKQSTEGQTAREVDLGDGLKLDLVRVPSGEFVMGASDGFVDEQPLTAAKIERPFWIGKFEITNEQYARFDAAHDSRLETGDYLQFSTEERGYPVNEPKQPVARVSWNEASAFCDWLSKQTRMTFTLPSEAEWEWACRAGTATPMWFGDTNTDFAPYANLADHCLRFVDTFAPWALPSGAIAPWRPAVDSVNDGFRVSAPVGTYQPNPWGLYDMHGNVAEWTRSTYGPHLGVDGDDARKVVRGGSWYDVPKRARSAFREACPAYRGVYDVGFRVVCEAG
jgi:formylglycine-generating enzyme required for sulfatase activity